MAKGFRQGRLGEEIKRIISEMLLREIKDPRLSGLVSVSAVEVTADGSFATVYVSIFDESPQGDRPSGKTEEVLSAFKSAKGLIKRRIGEQIKLRHIPELIFKPDTSFEYGRHIEEIIRELKVDKKDGE